MKEKRKCSSCNGSQICEHDKNKYKCSECSNSKGIRCLHNKEKYDCTECNGTGICEHKKRKRYCKECKGNMRCEHGVIRYYCKECKGGGVCKHGKIVYICVACNGKGICKHKIKKNICSTCNPIQHLISLQRRRILYILSKGDRKKSKKTLAYLGCDEEFLYNHIQCQLTDEMKEIGYDIDHIKPISKFNLEIDEELMEFCKWTNLRPLLSSDNKHKSNKWSDEDEEKWKILTHGYRRITKT